MEVLDSSDVCVHRVLNIYSSLDTLPLENTVQKDIKRKKTNIVITVISQLFCFQFGGNELYLRIYDLLN